MFSLMLARKGICQIRFKVTRKGLCRARKGICRGTQFKSTRKGVCWGTRVASHRTKRSKLTQASLGPTDGRSLPLTRRAPSAAGLLRAAVASIAGESEGSSLL